MNWNEIRQQLKRRLKRDAPAATAPFSLPTVVVEMQPDFVAGTRLAGRTNGDSKRLRSIGVAGLNAETLVPLANGSNIADPADLGRALQSVAQTLANGAVRYGLLVPDATVRVSLFSFETLPQNRREAQALLRWRMKEALPFPLDEARLSHQVVTRQSGCIEVLAVAAKASVLAEYERALEQVAGLPELVMPATLALLPLLPESADGGQLLIHICSGSITVAVTSGERLRLWRTRQVGRLDAGELCRRAQAEAARVVASCRDHLKMGISQAWLCARPPASSEFCAELSRALERPVRVLTPNAEVASALGSEDRDLFERYGAPMAGLVQHGLSGQPFAASGPSRPLSFFKTLGRWVDIRNAGLPVEPSMGAPNAVPHQGLADPSDGTRG